MYIYNPFYRKSREEINLLKLQREQQHLLLLDQQRKRSKNHQKMDEKNLIASQVHYKTLKNVYLKAIKSKSKGYKKSKQFPIITIIISGKDVFN